MYIYIYIRAALRAAQGFSISSLTFVPCLSTFATPSAVVRDVVLGCCVVVDRRGIVAGVLEMASLPGSVAGEERASVLRIVRQMRTGTPEVSESW